MAEGRGAVGSGQDALPDTPCDAALLDFRHVVAQYADLLHKTDYTYAQAIGARMHREGHPGLVVPSVRYAQGDNYVVLNPAVLSNPRLLCQLTYRIDGPRIVVEKTPGQTWMVIRTAEL